ncbi:MAG: DUF6261 family protein, partial [Bacteroidales bacterium]|nr:DUF6261 family protein [Bacteroidales bacterium]
MKITHIRLPRLSNDEHFQLFQFLIALVKSIGAAVLKVEARFAALETLHRREDEALKKITKSALTEQINDADAGRDDVFRGLSNAVLSGLSHFNPALRQAAERLQAVLDAYGNVAQKSHIAETSAVYNLVQELKLKHGGDVDLLGLTPWATELGRRNTTVQTLIEKRADESAARPSLALKEVRAELDEAYRAFAELTDALAVVARENATADAAVYDSFISRLNQRIDLLNTA